VVFRVFRYFSTISTRSSDDHGASLLYYVARGCKKLTALSLRGVSVGNECLAALSDSVVMPPCLREIVICNDLHDRNTNTGRIRPSTEKKFITSMGRNLQLTRVRLPNTLPASMQRTAREYTRRNLVLKRLRSRYVPGWRQTGQAVAALLFCLDRTNQSLSLAEHSHAVSYIILRTSMNVIIVTWDMTQRFGLLSLSFKTILFFNFHWPLFASAIGQSHLEQIT